MDGGRKRELVMEKKLRACRVNIIPRSEDYFRSAAPPRARSTTPAPVMTPSPEAVQKASNPIALRYWNQCLEKNSDANSSPSSPNKSVENETSVRRGREEACNRINQFITVDKMKRGQRGQGTLARSASESRLRHEEDRALKDQSSRLYNQVKAEQIKLAENRTEFQNRAVNFTGKSPQPFRKGASETRGFVNTENIVRSSETNSSSMVNLNDVNQNLIPNLNHNQKMNLVQMLLENLPSQIGDKLLAERLSSLPCERLSSVIANISEPTVNAAVPLMFPRTKDDVKLSLVLESVPKLTKLLRQN